MDANLTLASLYAVVDAIGPAPKPSVLIVADWMRYSMYRSVALRRETENEVEFRVSPELYASVPKDQSRDPWPKVPHFCGVPVREEWEPPKDLVAQATRRRGGRVEMVTCAEKIAREEDWGEGWREVSI